MTHRCTGPARGGTRPGGGEKVAVIFGSPTFAGGMRVRPVPFLILLAICLGPFAAAQDAPVDIPAQVFDLRSPRQGPTWIALEWDSTSVRHDVLFGEIPRLWRRARKLQTIQNVYTLGYSIHGLKPEKRYEVKVRAWPRGKGPAFESPSIIVATSSTAPRSFAGLQFLTPRPLGTFRRAITEPCLETYRGKLYVMEAQDCALHLSRVDPERLTADWTQEVTPAVNEEPLCPQSPDMCVFQDRLWVTWHVLKPKVTGPGPPLARQRMVYYDLAAEPGTSAADQAAELVSPLMEVVPEHSGAATSNGSLAPYLDKLWAAWLETWIGPDGEPEGMIMLAAYEPWRGAFAKPVAWADCPVRNPRTVSIGTYGGSLVLLFSGLVEGDPEYSGDALWFAQFDGRRFFDVRIVRRLGSNTHGRGVQLYDRFYFVFQSDADYPAAGGVYSDIALGRLAPGTRLGRGQEATVTALPYMADMKHNLNPDIAVVGDSLYVVFGKRDMPPKEYPQAISRGYGTWIGKVTRIVGGEVEEIY